MDLETVIAKRLVIDHMIVSNLKQHTIEVTRKYKEKKTSLSERDEQAWHSEF